MIKMRAKMKVVGVTAFKDEAGNTTQENITFAAVGPKGSYPADGSDENNTFARFTPTATINITIMNPALFGKYVVDEETYVDFTPVEVKS